MITDQRQTVACLSGRRVADVLAQLNVRSILLDDPTPLDVACKVDIPLDIDLDDWPQTETALRWLHIDRPVDGIFTVYDAYLPLASYLAARLNTRGLSLTAALNCHDKSRLRQVLQSAGLRVPAHRAVDAADLVSAAEELGLPVVVKQRTGGRGRGTLVCHTTDDVIAAGQMLSPAPLIVEEYVHGPEFAVQTITSNGHTDIVSLLAQHVADGPRPLEIGYDHPAPLAPPRHEAIAASVVQALAALGFDHSVAHTQIRLTAHGPVVINVAARPPGGQLCAATERVSGIDLTQAAAEIALGRTPTRRAASASHVLYRCVTFPQPGTVRYQAPGTDSATVILDVDDGDPVRPVNDPEGGSYGRIVVYGHDEATLAARYRSILDSLRLHVEPDTSR